MSRIIFSYSMGNKTKNRMSYSDAKVKIFAIFSVIILT